jgi:hypothetical protein
MTGDCVITCSSPRDGEGYGGGIRGDPMEETPPSVSRRPVLVLWPFRLLLEGPCPISGRQLILPTFEYKRRTCALEALPFAVLEIVSYGLWPWRDGKDDISKLVRGASNY